MQTLTSIQTQQAAGGLPWMAPIGVALADSGCFGPLVGAFSIGYAVGTGIYDHFLANRLTF